MVEQGRHVASLEVTIDPQADPGAAVIDTTDAEEIAELKTSNDEKLADVVALRNRTLLISDKALLAGYDEQ